MREAYLLPRRANGRRSSAKGRKLPQDWTAHPPPPVPVSLVYPEGRKAAAKVRAFVDFAAVRLRGHPALAEGERRF